MNSFTKAAFGKIFTLALFLFGLTQLQAGVYSSRSSEKCITSSTGAGATVSFNFANTPPAADSVTLWVIYRGDLNSGSERFSIADENTNNLGQTNFQTPQCGATPDSTEFKIAAATFNAWIGNGSVDFDATAASSVSSTLCSFGSCARMSLNYTTISGPDDAGVAGIVSLPNIECPDSLEVKVLVANFGTNQVTSVDLTWELNGTTQSTFNLTSTLDTINGTGSTTDTVSLGKVFFAGSTDIKAWTSNPNGVADTVNLNDTINNSLNPITSPTGLAATNITSSAVTVNFNFTAGLNYDVIVGTAGFDPSTGGRKVNVTSVPAVIGGLQPSTNYDIYIYANCGAGATSDTAGSVSFKTLIAGPQGFTCNTGVSGLGFTDDLETNPGGWTGNIGTSNGEWQFNTGGTSSSSTGPNSAHSGSQYLYFETSGSGSNSTGSAITPAIDLTTANDSAELSFWIHAFGATIGTLDVGVSTSATGPFTNVFSRTGAIQANQNDPWQNVGVRLDTFVGKTIYIEFEYSSGSSFTGDLAIDLVEVSSCFACPQPGSLTVSNITNTTADVSWFGGASEFDITWGSPGFTPGVGNIDSTTSSNYTITGLTANTSYDVYVRSNCTSTNNGRSTWTGPFAFTTPCAAFTATYTHGFETTTAPALDPCWSSYIVGSSADVETNTGSFFVSPIQGSQQLFLDNGSRFSNDTTAAVSPIMSDMTAGDKWVKFWTAAERTSNLVDLWVGTMSDPTDGSTITILDTIVVQGNTTYFESIVNLDSANGYNGTDQHFVFMHDNSNSFDGIFIDSVTYETIPACPAPRQPTFSGITDSSGVINFTSSNASTFEFNWGPCGFTQGSPTSSFGIGSKPFTLSNLTANTCYDVYIKSDCGVDGKSTWNGPFTFITDCSSFAAPYSQNFDGTTAPALDNCWSTYIIGSSAEVETDDSRFGRSPRSTPNQLFLDNGSRFSNDTIAAISPQFSDMTSADKRVRFWTAAEFSSNNVDLWVGTMSDPRDGSTISILDTIVIQGNDTYFEVTVNLDSANGYNGTDEYVVLMHDNSNSFDGIMIDDFAYETIPSCTGPVAAQSGISSVSATTANVFWNGGIGDTTKIVWGTVGFDPAISRIGRGFADGADTTFTITGLTAQTTYEAYIQDSCNNGGAGVYIGPFTFTTACLPVLAPFTEDFDDNTVWSGSTIDPCWSSNGPGGFAHQWEANSGTTGSSSTGPSGDNTSGSGQYLYTETSSSSPSVAILTTPLFDVSNLNVPFMSFFYHRYGSDMGTLKVEINDGSGWQTINTLVGQDQTASGDPWKESGADVSSYGDTIQFRFESTRGSSFRGDGAIDDFSVKEAPACPKVANLGTSSLVDSSAVLTWGGTSNATDYQVWFGRAGFFQGTQTVGGARVYTGSAAQDSLLVDTLTANTCYEFLVRGVCQPGDTSEWVGPVTFCTPCVPFTAPYSQNFDGTTAPALDACWSDYIVGSSAAVETDDRSFGRSPRSLPNQLFIDNGSRFSNDTTVAISPVFSDMSAGDKRVRFWTAAEFSSNNVDLWVGTMSDPNDGSTISILDTIVIQGNDTYFEAIVNLDAANGYNGTDQHVVLMHDNSNSFDGIMVDDFNYEAIPTCPKPDNFKVNAALSDSVFLSWNPSSSSNNNFVIEYGTSTTLGDSSNQTASVSGSSAAIGGLIADTNYCFWIRDICSAGDTSLWSAAVCVKTACSPFTAPYAENFDGVSTGISGDFGNCWESVGGTTSNYSWRSNTGTTGSFATGPNGDATTGSGVYLYTEASSGSSGDTAVLMSPIIDISSLNNAEMRYAYHTYGSNIDTIFVEVFNGTSWTLESKIGEEMNAESDPWKVDTVDLSAYSGSIRVRYRIRSFGCCSGDAAIDDFIIEEPVNSDLSLVSADFSKNSLCLSSNDTLIYQVANVKGSTYDLSTDPLVLNYDISGPISSNSSATFNTGTINAGDTNSFIITGIDLSTPGSYSLAKAKMDGNNFNLSPLNDSIDNADNLVVSEVWDVQPDTVVIINNTSDSATLSVNSSLLGGQEDSVITTPPLTPNNGSGGITFELETQRSVTLTGLTNIFSTGETSANLWMRTGGALHQSGSAPNISTANGWTQVVTNAPVSGANNTNSVRMDFGGTTIPLQANQRYGFFIEANTRYQTGTSGDQTIYSDGFITVNVNDSVAYGGGAPSPSFNPRRFVGGVIYEKPTVTPGFNWTLNGNVIDTLPETVVGPYTSGGVYNYVATLNNSPCGSFTDTVTVIVNVGNQCNTPTGLAATSNVGCDSIEVDWTSNTGGSIIQWGTQGFTPGTGNFTGIVTNPYTVSGLTPNTSYDFWVADTCGSDTSAFAGPVTVTTASGPLPVASINILGDTILGGQKQFFLDGSNSTDADTYLWDFDNGASSTMMADTATYAVSGSFTISLIVTNACGSDTATVNVISDIGLDENALSRSLNMYPNPTDKLVNIEFDAAQSGDASIRITDMRGRVVMERIDDHINGRFTEAIDVSNLANGVYMVEIQSGDLRAVRRLNIR